MSLMCSRMVLYQFNPSHAYADDAPPLVLRPSMNQGSNGGTTEPYSITLHSTTTGLQHTPLMNATTMDKDLERARGGEDGPDAISAFTPVLGRDDRPHASREKDSDEDEEKDKSETSSGLGVGLGMTV